MRDSYHAYLNHIHEMGEEKSFRVPFPIDYAIGHDPVLDTVHVSMLIDFQVYVCPNSESESKGWFPCSVKDLIDRFGKRAAHSPMQARFLKKLEKMGYIKRKITGKPPQRWLWIDYDRFMRNLFPNREEQ